MSDLTTPNKAQRETLPTYTPIDKCFLSPFLPQNNLLNLFTTPDKPLQIAYFSPPRLTPTVPSLDELFMGMCDNCTAHIFRKNAELNKTIAQQQQTMSQITCKTQASSKSDDVTPPKGAENGDSTCEASDLKPTKLDLASDPINKTPNSVSEFTCSETKSRIVHGEHNKTETKEERIIRRRKRKNMDQLKLLYNEYKKNSNWNKATMAEMAAKTGLSEAQVYIKNSVKLYKIFN